MFSNYDDAPEGPASEREKPPEDRPSERGPGTYRAPELREIGTLTQMQGHGHHHHDYRGGHHHHGV